MQKNYIKLEIEKNERKYAFECPPDAPLGEVHDILQEMKGYVVQRMIEAQQEKKDEVCAKQKPESQEDDGQEPEGCGEKA